MNDDDRSRFAERWLDSALDRYNEAEPRPGYETRLLATIAGVRTAQPRWRASWTWAALAAAAAVIVAVIVLSTGRSSRSRVPEMAGVAPAQVQSPSVKQQPPSVAPTLEKPVTAAARKRPTRRHEPNRAQEVAVVAAHSAQPKKPQFPTPEPLSEQERLMLAYVRNTPPQEIQAVIAQREAFQRLVDNLGVPEEQEKAER